MSNNLLVGKRGLIMGLANDKSIAWGIAKACADAEAKIIEYLDLYINLYYACCLNFQLFVVLIVFVNYIKESLNLIKTLRKFFYFGFFLIATLLTPPDIISQLVVGMSTVMIFELTIVTVILRIHVSKTF